MAQRERRSLLFILLPIFCTQVISQITGPTQMTYFVGEDACFRWSTNKSSILSATWGIKKGNIADPQFINVDILSIEPHINTKLEPTFKTRVSFKGNLTKGLALFCLKSVTLNDTNEYLASISDHVKRVLPYTVVLTVKEREDVATKEPKTKQVITSLFHQTDKTNTTEAKVNAPNKRFGKEEKMRELFREQQLVPDYYFLRSCGWIYWQKAS